MQLLLVSKGNLSQTHEQTICPEGRIHVVLIGDREQPTTKRKAVVLVETLCSIDSSELLGVVVEGYLLVRIG